MAAAPEAFPLTSPAGIAVFTDLLSYGPSTRAEVGARVGVSAGAVTKAVRPLLAAGMLSEHRSDTWRTDARSSGRPVVPLRVEPDWGLFAGVKLTGAEVIAILVDLTGAIRGSHRTELRSTAPSEAVRAVADALRTVSTEAGASPDSVRALGAAVSGDVDPSSGLVRFSPFLDWHDVALGALLTAATGLSSTVENDVRALTVVESVFGAGVGAASHAVVTVGDGIGCGISVDGHVLRGAHGVAGELGHLPLGDPSVECYCGGRGCLEAVASVPAVLASLAALLGRPVTSMAEASALADTDPRVHDVLAAAARLIGTGLASLANLVGPERIVLTGEDLATPAAFAEEVRSAFARQAFGAARQCEILVRPHPFEDWARGAAAVALTSYLATPSQTAQRSRVSRE